MAGANGVEHTHLPQSERAVLPCSLGRGYITALDDALSEVEGQGEEETMKDAKAYPIDLESEKVQFLEQMVSSYGLADVGKAVRCLIAYARENPDKQEEIFSEIRCTDC